MGKRMYRLRTRVLYIVYGINKEARLTEQSGLSLYLLSVYVNCSPSPSVLRTDDTFGEGVGLLFQIVVDCIRQRLDTIVDVLPGD